MHQTTGPSQVEVRLPPEERVTHDRRAAELEQRRAQAIAGGGPERVAKLHAQGRLSARERIALLIDPGTFQELGVFVTHRSDDPTIHDKKITGDGVVAGWGGIDGRPVYVFAQDFTVFGGTTPDASVLRRKMSA